MYLILSSSILLHFEKIMFLVAGIAPAREEVEDAVPLPLAPLGKIALQHSSSQIGDLLYEGSVFIDGRPVCDNSWDHNEALVVCRYNTWPRLYLARVIPGPGIPAGNIPQKYLLTHQNLWLQSGRGTHQLVLWRRGRGHPVCYQ